MVPEERKGVRYFGVIFDAELNEDGDYTQSYQGKFSLFAHDLEELVRRYDGRTVAVDHSTGRLEDYA